MGVTAAATPADHGVDVALNLLTRTSTPRPGPRGHNFIPGNNHGPRPTALLIGRNMDDSSVVWKYVRPVDSVRAAVAHQGQDQGRT